MSAMPLMAALYLIDATATDLPQQRQLKLTKTVLIRCLLCDALQTSIAAGGKRLI